MKNQIKIYGFITIMFIALFATSSFKEITSAKKEYSIIKRDCNCSRCSGTGKCVLCMGYGQIKCSRCGGSGRDINDSK